MSDSASRDSGPGAGDWRLDGSSSQALASSASAGRVRLLVFSPNWLGDAVMALPAIDDLRRHLHAQVIVAARPSVARLFSLVPWVDEVIELEWRSSVGDLGAMMRDIRRLRTVRADIALLLPNSFASAWLALAARVPERWGYATDGRSPFLTRAIPAPEHRGRHASRMNAPGRGFRLQPEHPTANQVRLKPDPTNSGETVEGSRASHSDPRRPAAANPEPRLSAVARRAEVEVPIHQGAYYQRLVSALGAANGPLEPKIAVTAAPLADARALLVSAGWDGVRPLVVFAPGAAYGTAKRWWPPHFATLAADVIATHGAQVVLVGSAADAETTGEVLGLLPASVSESVIDLAGRTTLETLAAVLNVARVCVSNDSGAMHLAAAVGVPLAAIFGPTNEQETAPLVHAPMELLIHDVSCRPCMLRECPIDHPCMRDLAPDRVAATVTRMLTQLGAAR